MGLQERKTKKIHVELQVSSSCSPRTAYIKSISVKCIGMGIYESRKLGFFLPRKLHHFSATNSQASNLESTSTYSDRNRFESQRMPGWWAWEQQCHNGGVTARCQHSQDDQEAHFQSAIESAALFWSVKSPACMNWRDLQSLACRHFCSGAEPWLSLTYKGTSIVIDII